MDIVATSPHVGQRHDRCALSPPKSDRSRQRTFCVPGGRGGAAPTRWSGSCSAMRRA